MTTSGFKILTKNKITNLVATFKYNYSNQISSSDLERCEVFAREFLNASNTVMADPKMLHHLYLDLIDKHNVHQFHRFFIGLYKAPLSLNANSPGELNAIESYTGELFSKELKGEVSIFFVPMKDAQKIAKVDIIAYQDYILFEMSKYPNGSEEYKYWFTLYRSLNKIFTPNYLHDMEYAISNGKACWNVLTSTDIPGMDVVRITENVQVHGGQQAQYLFRAGIPSERVDNVKEQIVYVKSKELSSTDFASYRDAMTRYHAMHQTDIESSIKYRQLHSSSVNPRSDDKEEIKGVKYSVDTFNDDNNGD